MTRKPSLNPNYKAWTPERRAALSRDRISKAQQRRFDDGIDPDEDTIYNVLCPQIRETWSVEMEQMRRVGYRCGPVTVTEVNLRVGVHNEARKEITRQETDDYNRQYE